MSGKDANNDKKHILKIRCSDGRSRKPDKLRGNWLHEIRQPGGILFPDFCALAETSSVQTSEMSCEIVLQNATRYLLLAIDAMVRIKGVTEIVLVYHTYCGAAENMGFDETTVQTKHKAWCELLVALYPSIDVQVLREDHSECGEHHHGHTEVTRVRMCNAT